MATQISDEEFDRQYDAAVKLGAEREKTEPKAVVASYNRKQNELTLRLANGATFTFPCELLPEFKEASPDDIAAVEVRPHGTALHWEKLDQDFTVGGLIASVFADKVLMAEMGRRGGRVQSTAKALAARENGRKGGRPVREQIGGLTVEVMFQRDNLSFTTTNVANVTASHLFSAKDWKGCSGSVKAWLKAGDAFKGVLIGHILESSDFAGQALVSAHGFYKNSDFQVPASDKEAASSEELALAA